MNRAQAALVGRLVRPGAAALLVLRFVQPHSSGAATTGQVQIVVTVKKADFCDVPAEYLPYVRAMYLRGITAGCGAAPECVYFCPYAYVTRQQMAVFLCRAAGKGPLDRDVPTFADVPRTSPYFGYVERLADSGSWGGFPPTGGCRADDPLTPENEALFCPFRTVTREQMAKFLCTAAGKSPLNNPAPTFADVPATNPFYGYVERLADAASWGGTAVTGGCALGPPRLYCPGAAVTRGQMAVFIVRAFAIPH